MTKMVFIERRSLRSPINRHRKGTFLVTNAIANPAGRWLRFDRYDIILTGFTRWTRFY